jgi:hypothetical protein
MTDIVEFIRARLDEDEQVAREASLANPGSAARHWAAVEVDEQSGQTGLWGKVWGVIPERVRGVVLARTIDVVPKVSTHIARHDPARVLRDVEAKRALLAEHSPRMVLVMNGDGSGGHAPHCGRCSPSDPNHRQRHPCTSLRLLALPYSDHPDYRQEWGSSTYWTVDQA